MCFSFVNPHVYQRHFHLVNRVDLETVLQAAVFVNDGDGQVRAAHKILGYDPVQKSFALANRSEDPSGDIGDPALSKAELSSVGTSSQAEMGLKRKPMTSLFELLEGQPGKDAQGTPQPNAPSPPPQP